jgi:hypothetical protein
MIGQEDIRETLGVNEIAAEFDEPGFYTNSTDAVATQDIVWAYPKVTKHYHNGIPTGKTYSAMVRDSKGQSMKVSGKKDSVPKLLESLERRMRGFWLDTRRNLKHFGRNKNRGFFN